MELVSIVIPVYNTGEPLRGCLESVIQQTYPNLEIVVVDDQSSDPLTLSLIQEYLDKDSRIKLVRNEKNRGISFSRNTGVDNTSGKYLSFLDSDDKFALDYVERMVDALEQNQIELVFCHILNYAKDPSLSVDTEELKIHIPVPAVSNMHDFIQAGNLFKLPVVAYGKMMRLDIYKQAHMGFKDELRQWEDNEWLYNCITQFKSFCTVDFIGVYRLIRSNSLSTKLDTNAIYAVFNMVNLCYQAFNKHGFIDQYYDGFIDFAFGSFEYRIKQVKNTDDIPVLEQEFIKLLKLLNYSVPEDVSKLKSEIIKSKIRYTAFKIIGNKQSYKKHKVRHRVYQHIYRFLQNYQIKR